MEKRSPASRHFVWQEAGQARSLAVREGSQFFHESRLRICDKGTNEAAWTFGTLQQRPLQNASPAPYQDLDSLDSHRSESAHLSPFPARGPAPGNILNTSSTIIPRRLSTT